MIFKRLPNLNSLLYPWAALIPIFVLMPIHFLITRNFDGTLFLLSFIAFFLFDSLGIQLGVHKQMSHRSFEVKPVIRRFLAFLSVLSGQGSPIVWVAIHMNSHHPHYDTAKDIHSPIHGRFYAFLSWIWRCDPSKIKFRGVTEYSRDPWLLFLHQNHAAILISYWLILSFFGLDFLVYLGLVPAFLSMTLTGFVNSNMHSSGFFNKLTFQSYQNYSGDKTYNSIWLGLLTMGLGLHNNHHKNPKSKYYDEQWYEFDPSRLVIPLIEKRGQSNGETADI